MDGFSIWLVTVFASYLFLAPHGINETVILLPDSEGRSSGVVIKTDGQEAMITTPYQGVAISAGKIESKQFSAETVQRLFPDVMQALPEKPRSFTLRFEENSANLTVESAAMIDGIRQEIAARAVPEIAVIGHTDRVGSDEDNLRLSMQRAEKMRDILVEGGVSPQIIEVTGRGELEPLVVTPDNVAEPLNRRVEINVR